MRIQSYCDAQNHGKIDFGMLKIKSEKKWPKSVIKDIVANKEMQKLVDFYESKNVDIIAKHYNTRDCDSVLITLQDEFGTFLGCYSSDSFKYDNFCANFAKRNIKYNSNKKMANQSSQTSILKKIMNFIKKIVINSK